MISKQKIKNIQKLHTKKWRSEAGVFLVEWEKLVGELLTSDANFVLKELYIAEKQKSYYLKKYSFLHDMQEVYFIDEALLHKLSTQENNLQCLALASYKSDEDIDLSIKNNWILVLDGIRDPGNFWTILRTAAWFWMYNIICSQDCVELYNPKVVSASMGAIFHTKVHYMDLEDFFQKNTFPVFSTSLWGQSLADVKFPKNGVLVMGSESHGVSELSKNYSETEIMIPRFWYGDSLNVAQATSILLTKIFL